MTVDIHQLVGIERLGHPDVKMVKLWIKGGTCIHATDIALERALEIWIDTKRALVGGWSESIPALSKLKVEIRKEGGGFVADPVQLPGSPNVGRGRTMMEAFGSFLQGHQERLGVEILIHPTAKASEQRRRQRAMRHR